MNFHKKGRNQLKQFDEMVINTTVIFIVVIIVVVLALYYNF